MAVGDTVRVGHGNLVHGVSTDNIPVFDLEKDQWGNVRCDVNECAYPRPVGGVKGGSLARITGEPVKVQRSYIEQMNGAVKSVGGSDFVMVFPVFFEHYQKAAYVHQNHLHVVYVP